MEAFKFDSLYDNEIFTPLTFFFYPCIEDDITFCKTKSQIENARISLEIKFFSGFYVENKFYDEWYVKLFDVDIDYNS